MEDKPTPETDAAVTTFNSISKLKRRFECSTGKVSAEFARRLERERDEAREELKHIEEYGTEEINAAVELRQKLAQALVEHDEAREALSSIHRWIERNHADGFIDSLTYLQNLERVTDCWYDRFDKIERERDEARKLKQFLAADSERVDAYLGACIERDEAREALTRITEAAQAVVDRWEQPAWKDTEPTAAVSTAPTP